MTNVIKPVTY